MQIHQSAEDYLECILKLSKQRPVVRSIDIANDMNYSKPSISVAMKNLRLNGYINVDESGFITLTDSGMEIASNIYDRHLILRKWLEFLGISPETAEQDACKIEHTLSKETYAALRKHIIEEMGEEKETAKLILIKARKDFGLVHNNAWSQGLFLWKKKRKSDRNFCTAQQKCCAG